MWRTTTALSIPAFRRVWAGATVSAAGDAASWVALVGLALGTAHASLPLLAVLYTAPVAVGGLVAGWALDRFDRRRLMIGDCVLRVGDLAATGLDTGAADAVLCVHAIHFAAEPSVAIVRSSRYRPPAGGRC